MSESPESNNLTMNVDVDFDYKEKQEISIINAIIEFFDVYECIYQFKTHLQN
jgi:hypothetical protein